MSIHVCDNALSPTKHEFVLACVNRSLFQIGWEDSSDFSITNHKFLHSAYKPEQFEHMGFMDAITDPKLLELIDGRTPHKVIINMSVPSDTNWSHTHQGEDVLLYYVNTRWCEEWAGETMFFDSTRRNVVFCSAYTPNRVIFFDGEIPHSIRPQSVSAPHYRFTLSAFFHKKDVVVA